MHICITLINRKYRDITSQMRAILWLIRVLHLVGRGRGALILRSEPFFNWSGYKNVWWLWAANHNQLNWRSRKTEGMMPFCSSLIVRLWCGVPPGLRRFKDWRRTSCPTMCRSTLAPSSWLLITTSCRSSMSVRSMRKRTSGYLGWIVWNIQSVDLPFPLPVYRFQCRGWNGKNEVTVLKTLRWNAVK